MTSQSWWWDIVRRLFASLDGAIYGLVQTLYQLFAYIASLTILNDAAIEDFRTRVYMILGIIMLFKIAFSLISLLMNPDDLADAQKGITGIVKRIVISLVLITFLPAIFNTAFSIQRIVLDDNIIGQFFLGNLDEEKSTEIMANSGNLVAFHVLSAFYYPNPKLEKVSKTDCVTNETVMMPNIDDDNGLLQNSRSVSVLEQHTEKCGKTLKKGAEPFYYLTHYSYNIDEYLGEYVNEEAGIDGTGSGTGYYAMQYSWLISTIAGVVVAWMFLGYCVDAGVRAVKLGVLQLIAPIPIFSYIDPKKGESIFQNWVKTTVSTYLSLFGRLVLIYFVIYICNIMQNSGVSVIGANGVASPLNDDSMMARFATAFIYIGLLLFAKEAPKLFSEMFGIKMEGSFGTKLAKMGMAGTALATGLGAAKLGGGLWRRHLEKDDYRNKISEIYKAAGTKDYSKLNEEQRGEVDELRKKMSLGVGMKQVGRGTWLGLSRGALAGKDGKVNLSTYRQTRAKANTIQKQRENDVSFLDEHREKFHENIGMGGKYGSFGTWSDEAKELQNTIAEGEVEERAVSERYVNERLNFAAKTHMSNDLMREYDRIIKGRTADGKKFETLQDQQKAMLSIQTKMKQHLSSLPSQTIADLGGLSVIEMDMNNLSSIYEEFKDISKQNQDNKKALGKLNDRMQKGEKK